LLLKKGRLPVGAPIDDVKAALKIKEEVPRKKVLSLRLMREVQEELEGKR
jgi:hypothetical protein